MPYISQYYCTYYCLIKHCYLMFNCIPVDWLRMTLLAASLLHLLWFSFLNNWSLCIGTGRKYNFTIPNFPPLTMTKLWSFWKQGYIYLIHGYMPNPLCIVGAQYVFMEWMPGLKQEPNFNALWRQEWQAPIRGEIQQLHQLSQESNIISGQLGRICSTLVTTNNYPDSYEWLRQ